MNLGTIASGTRTTTLSPAITCTGIVSKSSSFKFGTVTEVLLSRCRGKTTSQAIMTRYGEDRHEVANRSAEAGLLEEYSPLPCLVNNNNDQCQARKEHERNSHLPILYGAPKATPLKAEPTTLQIPHDFHLQSIGPWVPMSQMH